MGPDRKEIDELYRRYENVLTGLRDVQRVVLRRMRLRTLRLVLLWRRRGSADFRMAARELYHTMKPFRVPKHHDEE